MDRRHLIPATRLAVVLALLIVLRPASPAEYALALVVVVLAILPDDVLGRPVRPWRRGRVEERSDFNVGYTLLHTGRPRDAERHFRRALHQAPDDADARLNLGIALAESGEHEKAIPELEEAMRLRPRDAVAHYRLGVSYSNVGKHFAAIHALREAVRLDPKLYVAERALSAVSAIVNWQATTGARTGAGSARSAASARERAG